jgi:two-component system, LytTR family, response regulator
VKEREGGGAERAYRLIEIEQFVVKARDRTFLIPFAEVDWIEAAGKYVRVHTGSAAHLVRQSISDVAQRLDTRRFLRIHRGTIVNVKKIAEMNRGFGGGLFVVLRDGTRLTMSRRFRTQIREMTGLDV